MSLFSRITEEKIKKAMEEGVFDNLPGKGKPLKLEDNPYEPQELRAAHRLLKQNDFTLPWIEAWGEIEHERERIRKFAHLAHEKYWQAGRTAAWELARADFLSQVAALNRQILKYNLSVPAAVFQKPLFDPEAELRAALSE